MKLVADLGILPKTNYEGGTFEGEDWSAGIRF